jgi:hypothetical protein
MAKINYTDKVDSTTRNVPNINKVTAEDMNEIKASVNVNVDDIALKADLNGNNTNVFRVATAVGVDDAVTKAQLDASVTSVSAIDVSLDDTSLVVAKETNVQAFAETADAALLRARGTGVATTYTSSVSTGGTTFAQGAVSGEINGDQGYFNVSYAGATGVTVTNLTSSNTFVYIDNAGVLSQQNTEPTREDFVRKVFTMRIAVDTSTNLILGFEYLNNPIGHYTNSQRDLYSFLLAAGVPFRKDQLITGRATDLGFDVSAGSFLEFGGTGDIYNPNIPPVAALTNATFTLSTRTGFDTGGNTDLPKFWDNNGTLTALGSTTLVGHRLYRFSNGNIALQYGQGNYANMALAKVGARLEEYVLNPALKNATFFGWWFIESTATNTGGTTLTDFVEYTIGVSGGSSNTLSGCLLKGNNLSDLLDVAAARTNIGLNTTANQTDSTDKRFMSDVQETLLDSTSGTNTGDQDLSGLAPVSGSANYIQNQQVIYQNASIKISGRGQFNNYIEATEAYFSGSIFANAGSVSAGIIMTNDITANNNTAIMFRQLLGDSFIGVNSAGSFAFGDSYNLNNVGKPFVVTRAGAATVVSIEPTALTTGNVPYKGAGALLDSPISTDGTDVTLSGNVSATDGTFSGAMKSNLIRSSRADGEIYIQAATSTDFISLGTQTDSNLLKVNGNGNVSINNGDLDITNGSVSATDGLFSGLEVNNVSASTLKLNVTNSAGTSIADIIGSVEGVTKWRIGKLSSGIDNFNILVETGTALTIEPNKSATFASSVSAKELSLENSYTGNTAITTNTTTSGTTYVPAKFLHNGNLVGYIASSTTATSYVTSSDYRLKEDLKDFNGLMMVLDIPVYDYKWKVDESRSYGVMADELQKVLPDAVSGEKDAEQMQGVDYSKIVPLLIKSIQELKAEIELLKNK